MSAENLDPRREFEKKLQEFREHSKSTDLARMGRDSTGGRIYPSGRLQGNTALSEEVKVAAVAMGCDVEKCTLKFWSNSKTKEIIGKTVDPGTPGAMLITMTRNGFATLHMQNVMDEAPDLRPARKLWVPVSVQSFGPETYFIVHLGAARIRIRRRRGKSEGEGDAASA